MYTQPNKLLQNTSRVIKPYACAMIATEGPNILGKIDLAGVEIQYNTHYTGRIILNSEAKNQPLLYGFLGNNITFLLLKITYDETNPYCLIEEDQYIEYYFSTNINEIRYANKLLLLTGNSVKRIPQVYLNNPTTTTVTIDIMAGNLDQTTIDENNLGSNTFTLKGLYHNNILSDSIYNTTTDNYGSSQFEILDFEGTPALYLNYDEIDTILIDDEHLRLTIDTKSDSVIYLEFLSKFELYQSLSRIEYVMQNPLNRRLTTDSPTVDTQSPSIIMNPGVTPIIDNIYVIPVTLDVDNKFTLTKQQIIDHFISNVYDDRDGDIDKYSLVVTIRKYGELLKLDNITTDGAYEILMSISDIANNTSIANYIVIIDNVKPVITFNTQGDTFELSISQDGTGEPGLLNGDILTKTISSVTDNIDTLLPTLTTSDLSGVETKQYSVTITDSDEVEYSTITTSGTYYLLYVVSDLSSNVNMYYKTLTVID